ncbi:MAG: D-alanine--D-alanine ligase [Marinifilaceae bacterium]|jgi:D-alanine-D-alanine ligase|nr:D-alanine--D-alanine ligase [Marinifilaceae bacterium]
MKKNIAIVAGGYSSEQEISKLTAKYIYNHIEPTKYNLYFVVISKDRWYVEIDDKSINIDKSDFSFSFNSNKVKFDFAYIAIHGHPGEDGTMQAYFDLLEIAYSTGDMLSTALTFNKYQCNNYLSKLGFKTAKAVLLKNKNYDSENIIKELSLPCFVKPNSNGSSFGISKVKTNKELIPAIEKAFQESNEVIIEEFLDGLEFTCGVIINKDSAFALPITEVLPKNEFFDYEAKYDPKMAEEITPARITDQLKNDIQNTSIKIAQELNCKGIVRIDYMVVQHSIYVIEVNTIPGMTSNSFIPKQLASADIKLKDVLERIIDDNLN